MTFGTDTYFRGNDKMARICQTIVIENMRILSSILFFFPLLTSAIVVNVSPIILNNATFVKQSYYLYTKETSPSVGFPGDGESYIDVSFDVEKGNLNKEGQGFVEIFIVPSALYDNVGYYDDNEYIICCDDKAFSQKQCTNPNRMIFKNPDKLKFGLTKVAFTGKKVTMSLHYDVKKEGKYYLIITLCEPTTSNIKLSGQSIVMNPYGHLPARTYGLLPFTGMMSLCYTVLLTIWIMRCCSYRKELMSVHFMITAVICSFLCDALVKCINLKTYNNEGSFTYSLTIFSTLINAASLCVSRCLTIMIALGLGVSKASLGNVIWRIILIGIAYFIFSVWNNITSLLSPRSDIDMWRIIPSALIDSVIYFWILQALLDTIQELREKKQTSKLNVYLKLRNVIIVSVLVSTLYNIIFSYIIMEDLVERMWKFQWFFNDGIWSVFYLLIVCAIMILWSPNEHSLAYAYHVQVSTDEKQDMEEYAMPEAELQSVVGGKVEVATVDVTKELIPMAM